MAFLSTLKTRLSGITSAGLALMAFLGASVSARATTLPYDGFNPTANSIVNAVAVQPDGKILIGGYFTELTPEGYGTSASNYIARLNHDGTVDSSFTPQANGVVRTIVLQANGQVLIAGEFTSVTGTGGTATARNYLARLNANGSLDTTFDPNPNAIVYAIAAQTNGQLIIGGAFTSVQANGASAATTRNHIARLNADGSLDATYDPNTDKTVLSLAIQTDGTTVVGGGFSTFTPNGSSTAITRNDIGRLLADGTVDPGFDPEPNGSVMAILLLPNGQIVIGGQFTTMSNGVNQADFVARLNHDGGLDNTFIINPLEYVDALALQPDGKIIIGGIFTQIFPATALSATAISYAARINPDGTLDATFIPQPNQSVSAIAVQPDGDVILAGYFTSLSPLDTSTVFQRGYIARLNTYGVPDSTLSPDTTGTVLVAVPLSNGQQLVGGTFLSIGGATRNYLARMNADGSLDTTFTASVNGPVQSIAVASDGTYLIGGSFSQVDGFPRNYLGRLNPDGTIVGSFNPNPNGSITTIFPLTSGQILISGGFSYLTPNGSTTAIGIDEFARINNDGSVDIAFNPAPDGGVFAIAVQGDGHIVLGGGFTQVNGNTRSYLARINPDGTADGTNFDPEANAPVYALAVQGDGHIVIGGTFTTLIPQTGKAATTTTTITQPNGNVLTIPAAGTNANVPIPVNHMARLNADGTLDTSFFPDPNGDVLTMQMLSNGQFVVGGLFTSFAQNGAITGILRGYAARVNSDGSLDSTFNPDFNALVNSIAVTSGGGYLVGGSFTTLQPGASGTAIGAVHVALLNGAGSDQASFAAGANASAGGAANALAVQPNGQFLVAGSFAALGGAPAAYLDRFNADSTPDTTYNAAVNGPVNSVSVEPLGGATQTPSNSAVWLEPNGSVRHSYSAATNGEIVCSALTPSGQIVVGGLFSSFNGVVGYENLVRLNADGTLDTSFNPTPNGVVSTIALQANGQIIIGGAFTEVSGTTIDYLARLNADGTVDTTFSPTPSSQVLSVAIQSDGKILAGGDFTELTPNTTTTPVVRDYLARLNTDGTLDTSFNPDPNNPVYTIVILSSGQILVGGDFSTFTPNLGSTIDTVLYLARLNSDGTVDTNFEPDPNEPVSTIVVQSNSDIVVGGTFTSFLQNYNPRLTTQTSPTVNQNYVARIATTGTLDSTFNPNPNGAVSELALQSDGSIVLGGSFSGLQPNATGFIANRYDIARVNTTGALDPSFDPGLNGTVNTITINPDGSLFIGGNFNEVQVGGAVLIGGAFSTIQGFAATNLGRLNSDGTFDSSYLAHPDGPVYAITQQSNDKTLVGGSFATIESLPESNIARLNLSGTVDTTFIAAPNGAVNSIAELADGEIVIGGAFTGVNGKAASYLARLTAAGGFEPGFVPAINGAVDAVVLQPNGDIVIAGGFTSVDGVAVGHLARLTSTGALDPSFVANANGVVQGLSLQVDGSFYAVGAFTTINGSAVPYAAHLSSAGVVDTTFVPDTNGPVNAVAVQADGKVTLAGNFSTAAGFNRLDMVRYAAASPVTQTVGASGDESTLTWTRTGNAPTFSSVLFEESTDDNTWTTVGNGTTTDGATWTISGLASTGAATYYVRATGIVPTTEFSSSGLMQVVAQEHISGSPVISSSSSVIATTGNPFLFAITATGSPTSYSASGLPSGLSINPATGVISGTPTGTGTYTASISVTNANGTTVSSLTITIGSASTTPFVPASTSPSNRLVNLSCRADLTGSQVLIAGFVVSGTSSKTLVVRAVGPGLAQFNVPGYLVTPELQVFNSAGTMIYQNSTWGGTSALIAAFQRVGAFALATGSADAALEVSLPAGSYTMHAFDPNGNGGVVLAEIYDADTTPLSAPDRLINLSARGEVTQDAGALIGGFVISGNSTKSVLIRGIGPGLAAYGVTGVLPDPVLSVYNSSGTLVAQNLAWTNQTSLGTDQPVIAANDITAQDAVVGAFALSTANTDTALIANLPPGAYTFQITSASQTSGAALGEVYELP